MKRSSMRVLAVLAATSLAIVGCAQATPAPPTVAPPPAPTKAAEPTKPSAAPTKAVEPTKAPAVQPTAAPAKKVDFPAQGRSLTLMVALPAGGSVDIGARVLAPFLEKELGIPVQVVNKPGAGGQVGLTELIGLRPDGYTLGYTNLPTVITHYLDPERKTAYNRKSFQPVASTLTDPIVAGVKADSPHKTLKDLLDAAKAKPEQVKVSSAGLLSPIHLGALVAEKVAGAKFAIVLFDGGGPAVTALLGGHVDAAFNTGAEQVPHFKSGAIRTLGILDKQGTKFLPGVKTFEEQGYKAYMTSTHGLSAPAGTPKEVVDVLESALKRATDGAEYKSRMENAGLDPRFMGSAELGAFWDNMEADVKSLMEALKK